jgi:hypothetical protein
MTDTNTRKAVVTTAQVQSALTDYLTVRKELGFEDPTLEFDKGFRGRGFAVYSGETAVLSFDTKEDAYTHFSRYAEIAAEVLAQVVKNQAAKTASTAKKTTEKATA